MLYIARRLDPLKTTKWLHDEYCAMNFSCLLLVIEIKVSSYLGLRLNTINRQTLGMCKFSDDRLSL